MRRTEAIEAAAREVVDGRYSIETLTALSAALALPPDVVEPSERERALVREAYRTAQRDAVRGWDMLGADAAVADIIAATPIALSAQLRARWRAEAIREAADIAIARDVKFGEYCFGQGVARWIRALADEADTEKGTP